MQKSEKTQLKGNLLDLEIKIDKIEKWKKRLEKFMFLNQEKQFKIYIEPSEQKRSAEDKINIIYKDIDEIENFLMSIKQSEPQIVVQFEKTSS